MIRDFDVWIISEGETEDDAGVARAMDAQDAAEVYVEGTCVGPDWASHINGETIEVGVLDLASGESTTWKVSITSSIDYSAEQVDEAQS